MNITNLRLGFSCNSSSTHSLVFVEDQIKDIGTRGSQFGWSQFIAASREAKRDYLTVTLYDNLLNCRYPESIAKLVAEDWCNIPYYVTGKDGYIDHQSLLSLPVEQYTKNIGDIETPMRAFFDDLYRFVMREDVVILGGNDNEENPLPWNFPWKKVGIPLPKEYYYRDPHHVARKDGDFWVLFNKKSGNKIRFSFTSDEKYEESTLPELVDLKITNQCYYNCPWCYADSNSTGKHANFGDLAIIVDTLQILGVFEVAIGGGNPVLYPELDYLIQDLADHGTVANITIKRYEDLEGVKNKDLLSAIAVTAICPEDIEIIGEQVKDDRYIVSANIVMGTISREVFREILHESSLSGARLNLLGYKSAGRGADCDPIYYHWWLDEIKSSAGYKRIGIDTCLAKQYKIELEEVGIDHRLFYTEEGKFSMYIDAVNLFAAKSSYDTEHFPFYTRSGPESLAEQLKEIYSKF